MMSDRLEQLVQEAKDGDRDALEALIQQIQTPIYRMAFRMLGYPEDAEDAAQEILIKVITHLADFRGESAFRSWVYRIASNHLLTTRQRAAERLGIDLELWEQLGRVEAPSHLGNAFADAEKAVLIEEVRIGCMQGLLLCLDRDHRMAVILGQVFEVTSQEGAFILETSPEAFRKRLSRGRQRIQAFMKRYCGLVNPENGCRCQDQLNRDLSTGWVDPERLRYARNVASPEAQAQVLQGLSEMNEMARINHLFRHYPALRPATAFSNLVKDMIDAGKFPLLNG